MSLPVHLRRAIGLERGGPVVVRVEEGELRLLPREVMIRRVQDEFRRRLAGHTASSEDFLRERRAMWGDG
jgi:bifunctional DNA-binding transcriptional regulator/antitoxin component of YhaV-PrlF toxin-antitoxin module